MTLVRELSEAQLEEWKEEARRMGLVEMALLVDEVQRLRARVAELEGDLAEQQSAYGSLLEQHQTALRLNKRLELRVAALEAQMQPGRGEEGGPEKDNLFAKPNLQTGVR